MIPKKPVFGKDHAQTRSWGRMTIRRTVILLWGSFPLEPPLTEPLPSHRATSSRTGDRVARAHSASLCAARAGASSGSGCGRRWRGLRPSSACSSPVSWLGLWLSCRRSAARRAARVLRARGRRGPSLFCALPAVADGLRRLDRGSGAAASPGDRDRRRARRSRRRFLFARAVAAPM